MGEVLLQLADRVEALTGPDRRIDMEAWCACTERGAEELAKIGDIHRLLLRNAPAPAYTASLDAAMTLVPEGASWTLLSHAVGSTAEVSRPFADGWRADGCEVTAESEPLALCAAALRARAALAQKGGA